MDPASDIPPDSRPKGAAMAAGSKTRRKGAYLTGLVVLAGVLGFLLGSAAGERAGGGDARVDAAAMEAAARRFIEENPQFILDTLNRYAQDRAEADRRQTVGLVSANDGLTVMGNPDGDVTIYEFSDYNCGYCKRVFADLMRLIEDDGGIRLVVKEFPILSEGSRVAARYALAAAEMGRFGEFHRAAMAWRGPIDEAAADRIIADLGIDRAGFEAALADGAIGAAIDENHRIARQLKLSGTPAFVIGDAVVPGAIGLDDFRKLVEEARGAAAGSG